MLKIMSGELGWKIIAGLIVVFALCRWAGCDFKSRPQQALERLDPLLEQRAKDLERAAN